MMVFIGGLFCFVFFFGSSSSSSSKVKGAEGRIA